MKRMEQGFTLFELLVVMAIIGILASISMRQITIYQARAFNSRAEQDLRSAVAAQEAFFVSNEHYASCEGSDCEAVLSTFRLSEGVELALEVDESGDNFQGQASHPRGDKTYNFSSGSGLINAS
jgi:prepilin-type N-terminal cleavage/methylation domain-containing protein